jgi:hypothetical protein
MPAARMAGSSRISNTHTLLLIPECVCAVCSPLLFRPAEYR